MPVESTIERLEREAADRRIMVERAIFSWDPRTRPVHCSNCRHCTVGGDPDDVRAWCARGHGGGCDMPLWRVVRADHPRAFRPAVECPDFESMDDERTNGAIP